MNGLKSLHVRFPAALWALGVTLLVSGASYVAFKLLYRAPGPTVFLVGDSGIGNYRITPGARIQDQLTRVLGGEIQSCNWAEPGARTGDFYLQYSFGKMVVGKPRHVVVAFAPDKLLCDGPQARFDDDGRNLRWIPWTRGGLRYWRSLDDRDRGVAVVQQVGAALFSEWDLARIGWIQLVQWPSQRQKMFQAGPERRRKIEERFLAKVESFQAGADLSDSAMEARQIMKDFDLALQALRDDGIEPLVVLLPICNPDLARKLLPERTLAQRDSVDARVNRWLAGRGIDRIDYNTPERLALFPDSAWDDAEHIKDPAAFSIIAADIGKWVRAHPHNPGEARSARRGH